MEKMQVKERMYMFSEVNSLVFLLIFLAYAAACLMICCRVSVPLCTRAAGWESLQRLLLCGLAALLLTVATIYLWYVAILLLVVAAKYLCDRCPSKRGKVLIMVSIALFMTLVAAAGIPFMLSQCEEDEDEDDAVLEDVTENGMAYIWSEEEWSVYK